MIARYARCMRGGIARWKRGVQGKGISHAVAYALQGECDGGEASVASGATALEHYADAEVTRFTVTDEGISADRLDRFQLRSWIEGRDPKTGVHRGSEVTGPEADLVLDATVNSPKTFSIAAMLDPELAAEFAALQDRIRDRAIQLWRSELNARRGAGGCTRMDLAQIEVVELKHERSRALDPHQHRHMWLNVKVLGVDGKWSNIDSRVALKFQTVLNAEGDLAQRTDPRWLAALAAKGYTLGADGDIEQLAHVVRPLSRRSQQIEAVKAVKLAEWSAAHPGQEPSLSDLMAIDQYAWAADRPDKPKLDSEAEWAATVRSEIGHIDRSLVSAQRAPVDIPVRSEELDYDRLAMTALVEADRRSMTTAGRFSAFDLRAAAIRAVAASGVSGDRDRMQLHIDAVIAAAQTEIVDLAAPHSASGHIRQFVAADTVKARQQFSEAIAAIAEPGQPAAASDVERIAATVSQHQLDQDQLAAAAAIAGSDRLVVVEGVAGAGKTTMLKVAREAFQLTGGRLVVVAPTKKAAAVAGQETGAAASSLHSLLRSYGYRWRPSDRPGGDAWSRIEPGEVDPATGQVIELPQRPLGPGDRVVVDEAGMLDVSAAAALTDFIQRSGATLALMGDSRQVRPVGHGGAMATAKAVADRTVDLLSVHRFRTEHDQPDTRYAALTVAMRDQSDLAGATTVAEELLATGHVAAVNSRVAAVEHMRDAWLSAHGAGHTAAVIVATNAEADEINRAVQIERIARGQLSPDRSVTGRDGQQLLVGDRIQTRRNDRNLAVQNRDVWTIDRIRKGEARLASVDRPGEFRTVDAAYLAEAGQLAYASTVHGSQGATVHTAITGPDVDAAGLYVGMTRGRFQNTAVVIAGDNDDATRVLAHTMMRGAEELTLDDSRRAVADEIARAAHREDVPPKPWTERPAGKIVDLDQAIANAQSRVDDRRGRVQTVRDQIDQIDHSIREIERRQARAHARGDTAGEGRDDLLRTLRDRRSALLEDLEKPRKDFAISRRRLDALHHERVVRQFQLSPEARHVEDRERETSRQVAPRRGHDIHGRGHAPARRRHEDGPSLS